MTQSSDRLDRIETLLAATAEGLARTEINLARTEQIVQSNARAIEAWGQRSTEGNQQTRTQLETAIADTVAMIAEMGQQQQEAGQGAEQLKAETDQRFEVFLAEARADRQRIDEALALANRDRALNESEHRAFRETFQTMLAEIARLWQRVAG